MKHDDPIVFIEGDDLNHGLKKLNHLLLNGAVFWTLKRRRLFPNPADRRRAKIKQKRKIKIKRGRNNAETANDTR